MVRRDCGEEGRCFMRILLSAWLSFAACSDDDGSPAGADAGSLGRDGGGVARTDGSVSDDDAGARVPSDAGEAEACVGASHTPGGPDLWGGCWPGEHNTGVPAGTELTAYDGPCTITEDGTTIDAKRIECDLRIRAADVVVSRSRIMGSIATDEESEGFSFRISDSEVDVGDRAGTGVGAVNFVAARVRVRGGNRSMHCWHDCTITDSYVYGQFRDPSGTAHESGMRMGARATIRHNTIVCDAPDVPPDGGCSAALTGYGDFAPVEDNTIERNLFGATTGGYCTYGGSTAGKPFSEDANDIVFAENVWQRGTRESDHGEFVCGYYGSNTGFDPSEPGNVWRDNVFDDGTPVDSAN
jgi:hypothetical protein